MSSEEVKLVKQVAKDRGEDLSDFVRRAVMMVSSRFSLYCVRRAVKTELARLSYLSPEEKKALGLEREQ